MPYKFNILGKDVLFSDGRVNYVRLKLEYKRYAYQAEADLKAALPSAKNDSSISSELFDSINNGLNSMPWRELGAELERRFPSSDYGVFSKFIKVRNEYVAKYCNIVKKYVNDIVEELEKNRVYVDSTKLVYEVIADSTVTDKLIYCANYISNHKQSCSQSRIRYYNEVYDLHSREDFDLSGNTGLDGVIYKRLISPLNECFFAIFGSDILDNVLSLNGGSEAGLSTAVSSCANKLFSNSKIIEALTDGIWYDVFNCFILKYNYFTENNIEEYDRITKDEVNTASSLYKIFSERNIPEEDEKQMMIEALTSDPCNVKYYFAILDKYYDKHGELQRLAKLMNVDVTSRIEDNLLEVYNNGDIGTLESTLALKQMIIDEQKKYAFETSKALDKAIYRQYFLELTRKADKMEKEEVVSQWQSIQDGNNRFVEDKGEYISEEDCILILSRRFRELHAADYHSVIRDLGLTDDTSEGDKNYAFYQEGESYIAFEDACEEATGFTIKRDTDLRVQNYGDNILASGEVLLGYFHYTRSMDVISDGKSMIITNKRIYTKKEQFTDFSEISGCNPVKKLVLNYLIFEKNDGTKIQLPISKEISISAADMINRLLAALKGTEYTANSVEISSSKAMETAKNTVSGVANSAKKGLSSLFGKFGSKSSVGSWVCSNCGSFCKGAFCGKCGNKRPE